MYFSKSIALKSKLKFATQSHRHRAGFGGLSPSETMFQVPPIGIGCITKQWCLLKFQHVKPHCTNVKPPYWRLSGDGSVGTPSFSLAISLVTMVGFCHVHEFTFTLSFINPTHCCTLSYLTKPTCNYLAMLVYKPKQQSKQ